ncbi:Uncharacterised protein [Corynebacterium striatum]|nr:Uncharacterised protein [Corynebacterium striatum]
MCGRQMLYAAVSDASLSIGEKTLIGISDFGVLTFAPMGFIFRGRWSEVEQEPLRTNLVGGIIVFP